jgi:ComF family protein
LIRITCLEKDLKALIYCKVASYLIAMKALTLPIVWSDFISLFYPDYCLACSTSLFKGEEIVCSRCMVEMPQTNYHLDPSNSLMQRFGSRIPILMISALFRFSKSGRIQHLLHQLKYKNHPEVGIVLGKLYGTKLTTAFSKKIDMILPVPLHPSRLRRRGYNQSGKFAEGLAESLLVPFSDNILRRKVKTLTQTRKTKLKRWENVDNVFEVRSPQEVLGKNILLVDDVITTGATLEACGQVLVNNGCDSLSIVCIAEA